MSSDVKELEDRIKELERKLEALTDDFHHVASCVSTMKVSKLSDPRYPYWNWELLMIDSEAKKRRLDITLGALNSRAAGEETPDEMKKDLEGVPHELLYGTDPLKLSDVFQAFKLAMGWKHDSHVVDCIKAIHEQRILRPLCDFVLSALDE
jgi:hypothetical protein